MSGLLFQLSCLALAASSIFIVLVGPAGVLASVFFLAVCFFLALSFTGSDRFVALCYSLFFGFLSALFSAGFFGFVDLLLIFPASFFLVALFFFALKFFLLSDVVDASVLDWSKRFARVQIPWRISSGVKPGIYLVYCKTRRKGVVKLLVEKSFFGDRPLRVL